MEKWTKEERRAIGKRLQMLRKRGGYVQEDIAKLLGLKVGTISKYEQGERTPGIRQLALLADFLKCDVSELITGKKSSNSNAIAKETAKYEAAAMSPQNETVSQIEVSAQEEEQNEPVTVPLSPSQQNEIEEMQQTDFDAFLQWLNLSSIRATLETEDSYLLQVGSKSFHLTEKELTRIMGHLKKQFLKIMLEITVKK